MGALAVLPTFCYLGACDATQNYRMLLGHSHNEERVGLACERPNNVDSLVKTRFEEVPAI